MSIHKIGVLNHKDFAWLLLGISRLDFRRTKIRVNLPCMPVLGSLEGVARVEVSCIRGYKSGLLASKPSCIGWYNVGVASSVWLVGVH